MAAAYLLPKGSGSAVVFYGFMLPCLLAQLAARPAAPWRDPGVALAVGLVVWSGLTLLWGYGGWQRSGQFALDSIATLGFLVAMVLGLADAAARERLATLLVWVGGANAAASLAIMLVLHPVGERLHGWGNTSHPILGAMVMNTAYVTALASGLSGRRTAWPNLAAALAMGAFIALTESRGPILAAGMASLFLCTLSPWRWRALGVVAAAGAVWILLPHRMQHHSAEVLVQRGTSHRLDVWAKSLELIGEHPLLGHGLGAQMHMQIADVLITFPHDLYLSLLYYSGAVGLLLFVALAAVLAWRLLTCWDGESAWLAALGIGVLVGGLTDLGQVTKGPGPMWLILWLPVGLMLGWWNGRAAGSPVVRSVVRSASAPAPAGRPAENPPA